VINDTPTLKIQTANCKDTKIGPKMTNITFQQALQSSVASKLESWSKTPRQLVQLKTLKSVVNQFLATVHTAFADHYPLYLTPDMLWICITQGFAIHVKENAEQLRHKFVSHEGKEKIEIVRDLFVKGDPNNNWEGTFDSFSALIKNYIGEETHATIVSSFSTTGPLEKAISEIVLMDAMQKYFSYSVSTMCGIPAFYLAGQKEDWNLLKTKAAALVKIDASVLDGWGVGLDSIFDEILKAFDGVTNDVFWNSFYKYHNASGGAVVTGWVNILFPYVQQSSGVYRANNISRVKWDTKEHFWGNKPNYFPMGISKVPFVWKCSGKEFDMEFAGGMVGASQNDEGVLRPEFGWAVLEKVNTA